MKKKEIDLKNFDVHQAVKLLEQSANLLEGLTKENAIMKARLDTIDDMLKLAGVKREHCEGDYESLDVLNAQTVRYDIRVFTSKVVVAETDDGE